MQTTLPCSNSTTISDYTLRDIVQLAVDQGKSDLADVLPRSRSLFPPALSATKALQNGHLDTVVAFHKLGYNFHVNDTTLLLSEDRADVMKACWNFSTISSTLKTAIMEGKHNCAQFIVEQYMLLASKGYGQYYSTFETLMLEEGVFRLALYSKCWKIVEILKKWRWCSDYRRYLNPSTSEEKDTLLEYFSF